VNAGEQFPYRNRDPASGDSDLMPDLPIVLRHQTRSLSAVALVDSGASISLLPYSLGVQLGFDMPASKRVAEVRTDLDCNACLPPRILRLTRSCGRYRCPGSIPLCS
jgi:hypothetical protein